MKSSLKRLAFVLSLTGVVALSCTLPFTISPVAEPSKEIVYVEVTSTPAPVEQPTLAPVDSAPAPTVSVNLDGEWTIWQGPKEQRLKISFLQQGNDLVGNTATGDGHSLLFKGAIAQDGVSVTGTWESTNGTAGNFIMLMGSGLNSFSGNLGGGVPFCGSRGGAKPNPCIQ